MTIHGDYTTRKNC